MHVGYCLQQDSIEPTVNSKGIESAPKALLGQGFYCYRQKTIRLFLSKLAALNEQELCDLVHDSIAARLAYMVKTNRKDPFLERDIEQSRTLALIAAGCGGALLASIFRCLFFDYRHYSGGLPDLLLVRARYEEGSDVALGSDFQNVWGSFGGEIGGNDSDRRLVEKRDLVISYWV